MWKVLLTITLFGISTVASAVQVVLLTHNRTLNAQVYTLITDGSHVSGIAPPSTVVWDWDGTTLTGTGLYAATHSISSSPFSPTFVGEQITDLTIDTSTGTPGGTAYTCIEGTFLPLVLLSGCGGYDFGLNATDESTTVYGPGLAVSQTIGGDDVSTHVPMSVNVYNLELFSGGGTGFGDLITLRSPLGSPGTLVSSRETMVFEVIPVPAAAWLFGSALGLLGWMRRHTET